MSDYASITPVGSGPVGPLNRASAASSSQVYRNGTAKSDRAADPKSDSVELSSFARYMDRLRQLSDARDNHVKQVRQEINNGTYDMHQRFEIAVDRLIDDLAL